MDSPLKRSLDLLKKRGYVAGSVEQWVQYPDREEPAEKRAKALLDKLGIGAPAPWATATVAQALGPKWAKFRRDLFNIADIVAVKRGDTGTLYVQPTTRPNQAARIKKAVESPAIIDILASRNQFEVHGWAKVGPRGGRKLWKVTVTRIGFVNGSMVPVIIGEEEHDGGRAKDGEGEGVAEQTGLFAPASPENGTTDDEPF